MPPMPTYFPDDNDFKSYYQLMLDGGRGKGGTAPPGSTGTSGPFIPTFSGQAPGWAGLPQSGDYGGMGGFVRRRRMARPMGGAGMRFEGGGGQGPGTSMIPSGLAQQLVGQWGPPKTPGPAWAGGGDLPFSDAQHPGSTIASLLQNAFSGGQLHGQGYGGLFSFNPPEAIMQGVRQQAVADAGARERAARLGLQSRGDVDPSTYGFQALQSQLQGQDQTSRAMSQADLGLRQQQQENYWRMLMALLGEQGQNQRTYIGTEADRGRGGFDWGGALGGIGGLAGGLFGRGGGGGGGGPRMGQAGFQYPFYGG